MILKSLQKLYKKLLDKREQLEYSVVTAKFKAGKLISLKIEESIDLEA